MPITSFLLKSVLVATLLLSAAYLYIPSAVEAQVDPPSENFLFTEDFKREKQRIIREREAALGLLSQDDEEVDFQAPNVELSDDGDTMKGSGGILLSHRGSQFQARQAQYSPKSKVVDLSGEVVVSSREGVLNCSKAHFESAF